MLHHCDNPSCVNPSQLFLGTDADNMRDMIAKGRDRPPRGEHHGSAKLTWPQVQGIREQYRWYSHEFGIYGLAGRYGVSAQEIQNIVKGERWKATSNEIS